MEGLQAQGQHETPAPVAIERPTVGRRVWFWMGADAAELLCFLSPVQPFDAGVVFVHPMGPDGHHHVNLIVTDHEGRQAPVLDVIVLNPLTGSPEAHEERAESYATWMPYQVKKGTGSS